MFGFQESVTIPLATEWDHTMAVFSLRLAFIRSRGDKMKTIFHRHRTNASDFQYERALSHWESCCIVFKLALKKLGWFYGRCVCVEFGVGWKPNNYKSIKCDIHIYIYIYIKWIFNKKRVFIFFMLKEKIINTVQI